MIKQLFFDGVPVAHDDGRQPPGDRGAGPASSFQIAGEACYVGAADGEPVEGAGAAPGGELAQVQYVRLPGQAAVPGQEPGEGEPFGSVKAGWIVASVVDGAAVVIEHLPAGLRPEGGWAGPAAGSQRLSGNPP